MGNKLEVGQQITGKVTGIQPYGAFVSIGENIQGLVHISEITHGFVKDINDHLSVGDSVTVEIINIDEKNNKYSLSIKATTAAPTKKKKQKQRQVKSEQTTGFNTMEAELKQWLEQTK